MRTRDIVFLIVACVIGFGSAAIGVGYIFGMHRGMDIVNTYEEVFCKECCWKTEYFYTCTKDKVDLERLTQ